MSGCVERLGAAGAPFVNPKEKAGLSSVGGCSGFDAGLEKLNNGACFFSGAAVGGFAFGVSPAPLGAKGFDCCTRFDAALGKENNGF